MKATFTLLFAFASLSTFAQSSKEKELKTEIKEVTVFLQGAQVFETGTALIPSGKTLLKIKNLSPYLDEKSIRVKTDGDFTILSVNRKLNFLSALKKESTVDSLNKIHEALELGISHDNARLFVLKEKLSLLNENKSLATQSGGVSLTQLKQAMDFYESEINKIKTEEIKTYGSVETKRKEQGRIVQQLKELNDQNSLPGSEIEIIVSADAQVNGKFQVSYVVSNAGWYPKYDIRVDNVKSPLVLIYKAEVYQNTGVDWKNVKLRFSNAGINQSGSIPELKKWNLNYARNTSYENSIYGMSKMADIRNVNGVVLGEDGLPMPGVNVLMKGTTVGTVTDVNGRYSLSVPSNSSSVVFSFIGYSSQELPITGSQLNLQLQPDVAALSEVVTMGYSNALAGSVSGVRIRGNSSLGKTKSMNDYKSIPTTVIEHQTTVEFEIQTPYTINSNGEKLQVDLKKYDIDAQYEYYSIPKLDKDAFLIARIIHWDQYNLLQGEANLYFEDAFVGRSVLDTKILEDTLSISLGRDKNIVLVRERKEQFLKTRTIGSNAVDSRTFTITVRNKKSLPIKLTIFDQVPLSVNNDIVVDPVELNNGELDPVTGEIKWELNLEPQQQKEIAFQYEVKYPKREKLYLE